MRKLIVAAVVLALIYGGYWFVGQSQIQSRLTEALTRIDEGPYELQYDSLTTRGFPSRFDTTITDLSFEDPAAGLRWDLPVFQLLALSYQPNNVRAYFPPEQIITVDDRPFTLFTEAMAARGQVSPSASLPFQQAELELVNPRVRTPEGAELALARLFAAMRLSPETTQTYDAFIEARAIVLPENIRTMIDPQQTQPPVIQSLRFDSDVTLTEPLALNTDQTTPVQIETLSIAEFELAWGEISATAIGDLTPDADGVLSGSVTLVARNWQQTFDLAIANGMLGDNQRFLFAGLAENLDETPQIADTLTLTLTITDGEMSVGGYPLGPAPRLR